MKRRTFVLCAAAYLPAAALADLYDDYINSTSKKPFVAFLARKGRLGDAEIGHAFIGLGVDIDAGLRVYTHMFGLYPDGGALKSLKSVFTPVSGRLRYTESDMAWDVQLRRTITAAQETGIRKVFDTWRSDAQQYSLVASGGANCNTLAGEVARLAGLKTPSNPGTTRPWKYIEELKSLNQ